MLPLLGIFAFSPWEKMFFKMTDKLRGPCFVAATVSSPSLADPINFSP